MSWGQIIKMPAGRRPNEKKIWEAMKLVIEDFLSQKGNKFYQKDLRNYINDNLSEKFFESNPPDPNNKATTVGYKASIRRALEDINSEMDRHSKYFGQKIPRYLTYNYNIVHDGKGVYDVLKKSWDSTLKTGKPRSASRKLIEQTIKEMLKEFLEGKNEISIPEIKEYIINNLKEEHIKRNNVDGKVTSAVAGAPTRYINNRLDNHLKNKIPIMIKNLGYENKYAHSYQGSTRQIGGGHSYFIKKSDSWESMTDSMIAEGKLFEAIYAAILQKFKFSAPSKEKVVAYLNANYERHPLFSNKWSTKSEGEGQ